MKSLQAQFVDSKGSPIEIEGQRIIQMDRLPIKKGIITLTILASVSAPTQGIAIKANHGEIELSNGKAAGLIYVWDRDDLPKRVKHKVKCPDGELRIWNIYKVGGSVSEADAWTNNSGMIVEALSSNVRRYKCSDGTGAFDSSDLYFEIEWLPE